MKIPGPQQQQKKQTPKEKENIAAAGADFSFLFARLYFCSSFSTAGGIIVTALIFGLDKNGAARNKMGK